MPMSLPVQDTVGGHVLCREAVNTNTCPWHTKALWRLLVGRTTVSYDAYESFRRPRRAGATHGAKMPAPGEVVGA